MTVRPAAAVLLFAAVLALGGCGRRTTLETPVSLDQTLPWTEAGQRAANPARDARGRPERAQSQPGPTPAMRTFPLDFLLN